jgi:cytidylate kinase
MDGPAGGGKGTIAVALAQRFGFVYFESGTFFRVLAWRALSLGVTAQEEGCIEKIITSPWFREQWRTFARPALREERIGLFASEMAKHAFVRAAFTSFQRQEVLKETAAGVILEGRDTGSAIFPDADCKIFLTADPHVRARRRFEELREKNPDVAYETVLQDLLKRDANDKERSVGALQIDATYQLLDTSTLSIPEVVSTAERLVQERYNTYLAEKRGDEVKRQITRKNA